VVSGDIVRSFLAGARPNDDGVNIYAPKLTL